MEKIRSLLKEDDQLQLCTYCNKIYTDAQAKWEPCKKVANFIDFNGKAIAEHVPDPNWDNNKFISYLNKKGMTWNHIYWAIWAKFTDFSCLTCSKRFIGSELNHCTYHP